MNNLPSLNLRPEDFRPLTVAELGELYRPEVIRSLDQLKRSPYWGQRSANVTESTAIQIRFDEAVHAEYRASGKRPTVAILGAHDYEALRGFIQAFLAQHGVEMKFEEETCRPYFEFKQVRIFKSHSMTTGIVMGGEESF